MIDKANIQNLYRLSPLQGGMLFHALYDSEGGAYFEQGIYDVEGDLDLTLFGVAWQKLIERHDALRTAFVAKGVPEPLQIVLKSRPIPFDLHDIEGRTEEEGQAEIERYACAEKERGFDLTADPLLRIGLFRRSEARHVMVMSFHHIIMDGWCQGILAGELAAIYDALRRGVPVPLASAPQYRDYIRWLDARHKNGDTEESLRFWEERLAGVTTPTWFPLREASHVDTRATNESERDEQTTLHLCIDERTTGALEERIRNSGWTLSAVVQSLVGVLLGRLNGSNDALFLATVSGRPTDLDGAESIVGLFINTLPVRVRYAPEMTLDQLVSQLREEAGLAQPWQFAPLAKIQGRTPLGRELANTLLVIENYPDTGDDASAPFRFEQRTIDERTNYDLTVQVHPGRELAFTVTFPTARIAGERVADALEWLRGSIDLVATRPEATVAELFVGAPVAWGAEDERALIEKLAKPLVGEMTLRVLSTFTAEPVLPRLSWWLRQMGYTPSVSVAGYNQVFNELLDPDSPLRQETGATGVLFVRFDDWIRDCAGWHPSAMIDLLERTYADYLRSLDRCNGPEALIHLILPADRLALPSEVRLHLDQLDDRLVADAVAQPDLVVIDGRTFARDYRIADPFDPLADREGHIPFSPVMNEAIGTAIARRLLSRTRSPFKIIAVDCDNTLWRGICGEDGATGVVVADQFRLLQQFLIDRYEEGVLLALCSKNNDEDVCEVFTRNEGMLLRLDHVIDRRVNWLPKSENLRSLAADLNVGVDSILFIDDNPMEIAEVRENAPEVFSLLLPEEESGVAHLLRHLWGLDTWTVTEEDRNRSRMYVAERKRQEEEARSTVLDDFLTSLDISVTMAPIAGYEVPRAAQLTQRTNQFNFSTVRRTEAEIEKLMEEKETACWTITVEDRFGSYGLVGLLIGRSEGARLRIDTFLLSCRVLGRGVEEAILSGLRTWGTECGLSELEALYRPTPKNTPARQFLDTWPDAPTEIDDEEEGYLFRRPLAELSVDPAIGTLHYLREPREREGKQVPPSNSLADRETMGEKSNALGTATVGDETVDLPAITPAVDLGEIIGLRHAALYLPIAVSTGEGLQRLPRERSTRSGADRSKGPFVPPATERETALCALYSEVLGTESVGMTDDFFALGGNSLTAIELMSKLQRMFGSSATLQRIFEAPSPAQLLKLIDLPDAELDATSDPILPLPPSDLYPLSSAQQRLWLLEDLGLAGHSYVMGGAMHVEGDLDRSALERAFREVIARHESLRTAIVVVDGYPYQRIHDPLDLTVEAIDLARFTMTEEERWRLVDRLVRERMTAPFDLAHPPLVRVGLIRLAPRQSILTLFLHHIIADGWSYPILLEELLAFYREAAKSEEPSNDSLDRVPLLPPLRIHYKEYAAWQRERVDAGAYREDEEYWRDHLSSPRPVTSLPIDRSRRSGDAEGRTHTVMIGRDEMERLAELCGRERSTLFMGLLAVVRVLLWRLTGEREQILGVPVAGRDHPDLARQIGFYVNTLPLRQTVDPQKSFEAIVRETRDQVLDAFAHRALPFDAILAQLDDLDRSHDRNPLFDVMVVLQNNRAFDESTFEEMPGGLRVEPYGAEAGAGKLDLVFNFSERDGAGVCALEYRADLFDEATIAAWGNELQTLVASVTDNSKEPVVNRLGLIERVEKEAGEILALEVPEGSVIERFTAAVAADPRALAIIDRGETRLTYGQLDELSDRIADGLSAHGVRKGDAVAVALERGANLVATMLGLLKIGGIYLPIDPNNPGRRIAGTIQRSRPVLVVTGDDPGDDWLDASLSGSPALVTVETLKASAMERPERQTLAPTDLLYIIHTSGSTGTPKGVVVGNRAFLNMISAQIETFGVTPTDRVVQFASPAFDASLSEIFMALLSGATLVFPDREEMRDPDAFRRFLDREGVTVATIPPQYLRTLGLDRLSSLRVMITAGEAAPVDEVMAHLRQGGALRVFNAYGPTESAVCATIHAVDSVADEGGPIPIGPAIHGLGTIVVDGGMLPLPDGVAGELLLYGVGLADGYWNDPIQTAERFITPFWSAALRCYRTGDRVVRRADGSLEFHGRIDEQVKIRGHRVEPAELCHALRAHPAVADAAVVVHDAIDTGASTGAELIAWVVPAAPDSPLDLDALRAAIVSELPSFLVPASIRRIESIPMTNNGKVDTARLRSLGTTDARDVVGAASDHGANDTLEIASEDQANEERIGDESRTPQSEIEHVLLAAVSDVLNRPNIRLEENFFAIGGDSLKAIRLHAALRERGYRVEIRHVYDQRTLAGLARTIGALEHDRSQSQEVMGAIPLTPVQRWAVATATPEAFPDLALSLVAGASRPIDSVRLERALVAVVNAHDALRMTAASRLDGGITLHAHGRCDSVEIAQLEVDAMAEGESRMMSSALSHTIRERATRFQFDGITPLYRAAVVRCGHEELFVFSVHHLVVDAVSIEIILGDLDRAYRAIEAEEELVISGGGLSFGQWALRIGEEAATISPAWRAYWTEIAECIAPLPRLYNAGSQADKHGAASSTILLSCGKELTERLRRCSEQRVGVHHILLAALRDAVDPYLDPSDALPVMIESHGRTSSLGLDVSGTVGWLTTLYPILLGGGGSVRDRLRAIRSTFDRIAGRETDYLLLATAEGWSDGAALPRITFNYLGEFRHDGEKESSRMFDFTPLDSNDDANRLNDIEINALIEEGELRVRIGLAPELPPHIAERLTDHLVASIEEIVSAMEQTGQMQARVIALPSVGGVIGEYDALAPFLDASIGLVTPETAGHARRIDEEPATSIPLIAADIVDAITPSLDLPYILLGHSMGALLAHETVMQLRERGAPLPQAVILSASPAPCIYGRGERPSQTGMIEPMRSLFTELMKRDASLPEDFVERSLMGVQADLEAVESYRYVERPPLSIPFTLLYGSRDDIGLADILAWSRETSGEIVIREVEGEHGFIRTGASTVVDRIHELLAEAMQSTGEENGVADNQHGEGKQSSLFPLPSFLDDKSEVTSSTAATREIEVQSIVSEDLS